MDIAKIIDPGPLTTIQDSGRKGYQRFGMPIAGAVDLFSYRIANILVENDENAAAIEFTMQGPKMTFLNDTVIAVTGAETVPFIDNKPFPIWQSIFIKKGSILSFKGIKSGFRGYIAVKGGVDVPDVMGSSSTYLRAKIGGINGQKLKSGVIIKSKAFDKEISENKVRKLPVHLIPDFYESEEIRVILGPQDDLFESESIEVFLSSEYKVTSQSDRMGYRLEGSKLIHKEKADIISDGIPLGAIQVPGHGQPIILLSDRQTTGGYAKIATVISTDLNKVNQLKPGNKIKFKEVSLDEAYKAACDQEKTIKEVKELHIRSDTKKVYRLNISGRDYITSVKEIN